MVLEKIFHVNINQKKARLFLLIEKKSRFQRKENHQTEEGSYVMTKW